MCFIVPQHTLLLAAADAACRSYDACESFGAMFKKLIKHATCRHRLTNLPTLPGQEERQQQNRRGHSPWATSSKHSGALACASHCNTAKRISHSSMLYTDERRTSVGRAMISRKVAADSPIQSMPSVYEASKVLYVATPVQ